MEQWRPIPGYEGLYEVSDLGRVRSLGRTTRDRKVVPPRVMKGSPDMGGYLSVKLYGGEQGRGGRKLRKVHHLVLEAFVEPKPQGKMCRHLDGDPQNNSLENLRWGTCAENAQDKIRHGRAGTNTTLPGREARKAVVFREIDAGRSIKVAAVIAGVTYSSAWRWNKQRVYTT